MFPEITKSRTVSVKHSRYIYIEKRLEDMKMNTFKEIINSFENNDINAFETLVRKERALYHPNENLGSFRSPSQLESQQP